MNQCNHLLLVFCVMPLLAQSSEEGLPVPFTSYEEALTALRGSHETKTLWIPGNPGYLSIEIDNANADEFWTFTLSGHPAHPSAIKRIFSYPEGKVRIRMAIICEAEPVACTELQTHYDTIHSKIMTPKERGDPAGSKNENHENSH